MIGHLIVRYVTVRRRGKKPLLKLFFLRSIKYDVISFAPLLWCRAVVPSVLDLVIYDVKYLLNLCVRYTEEECCLNLEPQIT
jgi:hypothetical protein